MFTKFKKPGNLGLLIVAIIAIIMVVRLYIVLPDNDVDHIFAGKLDVKFLDVGQGDCEIITLPDGRNIIIDAGKNETEEDLVSKLTKKGFKRFDYVVITHPHEDHIGGMAKIIESFEIGEVYMPNKTTNTKIFSNILTALENKNCKVVEAKNGVVMIDEDNIKAEFLAPCSSGYKDINNYSAVLKLTYNNFKFLFAGDAGEDSEMEMLESGQDLSADVLKVGHHGSKYSSTTAFIKKVNPKYAIIEVGKDNSYGHPAKDTLYRLKKAKVYRTDEKGTIDVVCDGNKLTVLTEKE